MSQKHSTNNNSAAKKRHQEAGNNNSNVSTDSKPVQHDNGNGLLAAPAQDPNLPPVSTIRLSLAYWFFLLGILFILKLGLHQLNSSCEFYVTMNPNETLASSQLQPHLFSEAIARAHLREVTRLGPRPTGTENNEVHAPNYLRGVFRQLAASISPGAHPYKIIIDEQISKQGSFSMDFLHNREMSSVYRNIRNMVLRLHDTRGASSTAGGNLTAILINCHYDSVVGSPGATDDFISCAVMLEIIRVLIARQTPLTHDLIFLFNGAEENLMQASHAFVTQHPWFKDVKAFVNMEGAGAAGKQFLFQAGPNAPWLVEEFANSVERPFASILGMEVFQSGLIPGDTDFRIFRDYGLVPGLDLAFIQNGFVYHTIYDEEKRVPPACLKLAGLNVVSFLEKLAQSPFVSDPNNYQGGDVIFFDVLGFFMVRYHALFATVLNLTLVGLVVLQVYRYIWQTTLQAHCSRRRETVYLLCKAALNHIIGLLAILFVLLMIVAIITVTGKYLSWYALRYNLLGLYVLPFFWAFFTYHSQITHQIFCWSKFTLEQVEEAHHLAAQSFLALIVFSTTVLRIYSAYMFVIWLAFSLVGRWVFQYCSTHPSWNWIPGEVLFTLHRGFFYAFPMMYHVNRLWGLHEVFIPIMGRSGNAVNPDLFLVVVTLIFAVIFPLFLAGDVFVTKAKTLKTLRFFLFHMSLSFIVCILFTELGFPYNTSSIMPRQQRVALVHFRRTFHNLKDQVEDSGIWTVPLDVNGKRHFEKELPNYRDLPPVECEARPYCGMPHLYPLASNFPTSYILPSDPPVGQKPLLQLRVLSKTMLSPTLINLTLAVQGPSHNHIFLMTPEPTEVSLLSWSVEPSTRRPIPTAMPNTAKGEHYFIYNGYGDTPKEPLTVWFTFQLSNKLPAEKAAIVEVALSGQYFTDDHKSTSELDKLLSIMPKFVVPTAWTAVYENWQIDLRHVS